MFNALGRSVIGHPKRLFESAVEQYSRYRTDYPSKDVEALAATVGFERNHTVIDVGCGTGQLALPLARHAETVIAIDPVPDMLAAGRQAAAAAGLTNITWLLGDSSKLESLVRPGARAATFAASFHWTDRAEVAGVLDTLLDDKGTVVVINDDLDDDEQPRWVHAVTDLRTRYLGNQHAAAIAAYTDPPVSHREILESSPFGAVERLTWSWERRLTVEEAVGLQFTYSFSTPAVFGDRDQEFAADARDTILALHPDGYVNEAFRVEVLVASRP